MDHELDTDAQIAVDRDEDSQVDPQCQCRLGSLMKSLVFLSVFVLLGAHALLYASPETADYIVNFLPVSLVADEHAVGVSEGSSCCSRVATGDYASCASKSSGSYAMSGGCGPICDFSSDAYAGDCPASCENTCSGEAEDPAVEQAEPELTLTLNDWLPELEPSADSAGG